MNCQTTAFPIRFQGFVDFDRTYRISVPNTAAPPCCIAFPTSERPYREAKRIPNPVTPCRHSSGSPLDMSATAQRKLLPNDRGFKNASLMKSRPRCSRANGFHGIALGNIAPIPKFTLVGSYFGGVEAGSTAVEFVGEGSCANKGTAIQIKTCRRKLHSA
jgi:hypothetical protein